MYIDAAYYHNSRQDFKDRTHPLFVGSCGHYRVYTKYRLPTHWRRGRVDYQILYVASGKCHFYFHGEETIVPAGTMVLYRPREEQKYYYYGADSPDVYWVHFTGSNVKNILRSYGIADDIHTIRTGTSLEFKHLFSAMIQELKLCKPDYETLLVNYLQELLILVHRVILLDASGKKASPLPLPEMDAAVSYFHENYNKNISIESYASDHNMSVSWFIRNFKEYTNATPAQYLLSLRISNARVLLESTSYNISEISNIVGYDNPLYFSRVFKKQFGISPSEFRRQQHPV